ncbi:MAG: DUF3341 domain-containing protein [Rhodospirillales bacterium]|nr:DUF3341 domain-containing protein [Rhodospirillales bacterium]
MRIVVGAFADKAAMQTALARLREAGFNAIETYTPSPPGEGHSPLPLVILVAGLVGAALGFWWQTHETGQAYPLDIGGRAHFSWPAYVPIAFEIGVLFAITAGVVGFFLINRMPQLWAPVDEAPALRRATSDRWCIAIHTEAPDQARHALWRFAALQVDEVPA